MLRLLGPSKTNSSGKRENAFSNANATIVRDRREKRTGDARRTR
jgi:hypothetical protein